MPAPACPIAHAIASELARVINADPSTAQFRDKVDALEERVAREAGDTPARRRHRVALCMIFAHAEVRRALMEATLPLPDASDMSAGLEGIARELEGWTRECGMHRTNAELLGGGARILRLGRLERAEHVLAIASRLTRMAHAHAAASPGEGEARAAADVALAFGELCAMAQTPFLARLQGLKWLLDFGPAAAASHHP